jgi:hypothetical protein
MNIPRFPGSTALLIGYENEQQVKHGGNLVDRKVIKNEPFACPIEKSQRILHSHATSYENTTVRTALLAEENQVFSQVLEGFGELCVPQALAVVFLGASIELYRVDIHGVLTA